MRLVRIRAAGLVLAAASLLTIGVAGPSVAGGYPRPGATSEVDLTSQGAQVRDLPCSGSNYCGHISSISADGRYVAFDSNSPDFVPHDTNGRDDVFLRDLRTGTTRLVSVGLTGHPAEGVGPTGITLLSDDPSVSGNGRYVAFESYALNLVPGQTNVGNPGLFVRDMQLGRTVMIRPFLADGTLMAPIGLNQLSLSSNGDYLAFGAAPVALGSDSMTRYFREDLQTGQVQEASVSSTGAPAQDAPYLVAGAFGVSISATGRYVVFTSNADNLVPNLIGNTFNVFWHDFGTGKTELVSANSNGAQGLDPVATSELNQVGGGDDVTPDGRYVLFDSSQALVPNDTTHDPTGRFETPDVFVKDMQTGRVERISVSPAGEQADGASWAGSISANGQFAVFMSGATNIVTHPASLYGVFGYDLATGEPVLLSRSTSGAQAAGGQPGCASGPANNAASSGDPETDASGELTTFTSCATNLVAGADRNPGYNVFLRDDGANLAVGGLVGAGRLSVVGRPGFETSGIVSATSHTVLSPEWVAAGASLSEVTLAYRAATADLFVRLAVAHMPEFTAANPALVYGLQLTANQVGYQVRVAKAGPGARTNGGASFVLYRRTPTGGWTQVATLLGGYGTTGEEVVFALPLRDLGLGTGGRLGGLTAFTGLGTPALGPLLVLDRLSLDG